MILGRYTNHLEIVMQERIENPHHDCHGDVVLALASVPLGRAVGAIDIGVPKASKVAAS